jgi:DnaK suppressor protein
MQNHEDRSMNLIKSKRYQELLDAKQVELSAALQNRRDIAIEKAPDAIDELELARERELAIQNLDRESMLLRNVEEALGRIGDGSYGTCLRCEEDIKPKRLDAVPWTRYCIRCQEAAERHEDEEGRSGDGLLAA